MAENDIWVTRSDHRLEPAQPGPIANLDRRESCERDPTHLLGTRCNRLVEPARKDGAKLARKCRLHVLGFGEARPTETRFTNS